MRRWLLDHLQPSWFRQKVEGKASALIAALEADAYAVAREQARTERAAHWWTDARFWGRVAIEVARREGRADEIGVKGADRWPGPR